MMFWLYWTVVALYLFATSSLAVATYRAGWTAQGVAQAVTPSVWILLCSAALLAVSGVQHRAAWKVGGQALLVTLSLLGAVFGFLLGGISGIGLSYGNGDVELAQDFVLAFALGVAIALPPSLIVATIATFIAIASRRLRRTSVPVP